MTHTATQSIRNIIWLALKDYRNEWQMSGCFVLALAAVLGPLMILFGLKFGIVGNMVSDLVEDPRNREIRPVGSGRFDQDWFQQLQRRPEVAFLVPRTRNIAASLQLKSDQARQILAVELIPTAVGEPLLNTTTNIPEGLTQLLLSATAARKLKVATGDVIAGSLSRQFENRRQRVNLSLSVAGVAQPGAFSRDGAFVSLALLSAIEDFRDGHAVAPLGWNGDSRPQGARTFPGFRLYTHSIYDVPELRDQLTAAGVEVRTRAADIEIVQSLDRNLSRVFWLIAGIGLFGFALSLAASLWANVERKQRDLSVLRLVGFRTGDIVWFPVIQALITALLGWILASLIYLGFSLSINSLISVPLLQDRSVCHLLPRHFVTALWLTSLSAMFAAALAGYRSTRIQPSDGLREL